MKAIENFRFGYDDLLILPRVWSEMRPDCYRPGARGETKQTGYRQASEMVLGEKCVTMVFFHRATCTGAVLPVRDPRSAVLVRAGHPAVG